MKTEKGYITLMGVLIVGAMGLTIGVTLLILSVTNAQTALSYQNSILARSYADTCADEALTVLELNSSFRGNGLLNLTNGTCSYTIEEPYGVNMTVGLNLDESAGATTFTDFSGNSNSFICSGGSCPTSGASGYHDTAVNFDGVDDNLLDDDGENYINGLTEFTVAMWIKSNETNSDRGFFITKDPDEQDNVLAIRYDQSGINGGCTNCIKTGITVDTGSGTQEQQLESSSNVQTTGWQHIALTWRSGEPLKLYINGDLDIPSANYSGVAGFITGATRVFVGRGAKDSAGTAAWNGSIDDVGIWSRELSEGEIRGLFLSGALSTSQLIVKTSGNSNNSIRKNYITIDQVSPDVTIYSWQEVGDY